MMRAGAHLQNGTQSVLKSGWNEEISGVFREASARLTARGEWSVRTSRRGCGAAGVVCGGKVCEGRRRSGMRD